MNPHVKAGSRETRGWLKTLHSGKGGVGEGTYRGVFTLVCIRRINKNLLLFHGYVTHPHPLKIGGDSSVLTLKTKALCQCAPPHPFPVCVRHPGEVVQPLA